MAAVELLGLPLSPGTVTGGLKRIEPMLPAIYQTLVTRQVSLLPFGNSERPDSPFRFASWAAWTRGELRPAPLSRQAVEALATSRAVLSTTATPPQPVSRPDPEESR